VISLAPFFAEWEILVRLEIGGGLGKDFGLLLYVARVVFVSEVESVAGDEILESEHTGEGLSRGEGLMRVWERTR